MTPIKKGNMTRNSVFRKISILLFILVGVVVGVGGLWFAIQNITELRFFLFEQATANLPQAKIAEFVQSIVQGDKDTALKLWEVFEDTSSEQQRALIKRREKIVSDLVSAKITPEYRVLNIDWWATCCEPRVINDSRNAGGARINVRFVDTYGNPRTFFFDVFTREQPYWGGAEGFPPRDWVIRDVYPHDQKPMY